MKVLIAVIAYNEALNIGNTLRELKQVCPEYDLVVIDNHSKDNTVELAREEGVTVVSHCINTGSSMGTVATYFRYAWVRGYDILCQFDSDGQHRPQDLPVIIRPILEGKADYVVGSRFLNREGFQSYPIRRLAINTFAWLLSRKMNQKVTDVTSGLRAYNRKVITFFARRYDHELYDTMQLLMLSYLNGARIMEVPVVMRPREFGKSEYDVLTSIKYILKSSVNYVGLLLNIKKNGI